MIPHSITAYEPNPECPHHDADGLVCEDHPREPWQQSVGTHCGAAGMPCACVRWPCGAVGHHPQECPA